MPNQTSYVPRYGLNLSALLRLFKTDVELGLGGGYSWSKTPMFLGGPPFFEGSRKELPTVAVDHNQWEARLFVQYPFIKKQKIQISGLLGVELGVADFPNQFWRSNQGVFNLIRAGEDLRFDYIIYVGNQRNTVALRSGITTTISLSDQIALNVVLAYRLGLCQSLSYLYIGDIWVNKATEPLRDSYEKFSSNSEVF